METTRPAQEDDRETCVALLNRALAEIDGVRGGAMLRGWRNMRTAPRPMAGCGVPTMALFTSASSTTSSSG